MYAEVNNYWTEWPIHARNVRLIQYFAGQIHAFGRGVDGRVRQPLDKLAIVGCSTVACLLFFVVAALVVASRLSI